MWELGNDAEMDPPFHLHGTFFQVLDQPHLGWKDPVNVPRKSTVRIALDFDNPGPWMHAERGMMGVGAGASGTCGRGGCRARPRERSRPQHQRKISA